MGHGKRRHDTPSPSPSRRRRRRSDTPSPSSGHDRHRERMMTSPSPTAAGADRDNSGHRDRQLRPKSRSASPASQDIGGRDCSSPESARAKKKRKRRKKEHERRERRDGEHRKKKRRKDRSRASASPPRDHRRKGRDEEQDTERESSTEGPGETGHVTAGASEGDGNHHARETASMVRAATIAVQTDARQQREAGASTSAGTASRLVLHEETGAGQGAEKKSEESPVLDEDAPTPPGSPVVVSETAKAVVQPPETSPRRPTTSRDGEDIVLGEDAPTRPGSPMRSDLEGEAEGKEDAKPSEGAPVVPGVSKASFFAQLVDAERRKGTVGTMHATGRGNGAAAYTDSTTARPGDWECQKCGKMNYKNASACDSCHALKRMTLWR